MSAAQLNLRRTSSGVVLTVRLTPKSAHDEIVGVESFGDETVLKARVRALPAEGRANEALEKLIARWLEVPPSSVRVIQGSKSRLKQVKIDGDSEALVSAIASLLR